VRLAGDEDRQTSRAVAGGEDVGVHWGVGSFG
jgi:hypothetical protein